MGYPVHCLLTTHPYCQVPAVPTKLRSSKMFLGKAKCLLWEQNHPKFRTANKEILGLFLSLDHNICQASASELGTRYKDSQGHCARESVHAEA